MDDPDSDLGSKIIGWLTIALVVGFIAWYVVGMIQSLL